MSASEKDDNKYDPRAIEPKWQETWKRAGVFRAVRDPAKKKYFIMEMFPYPSGRLHMGHVRNYTIGDVVARLHRMRGESVLYPMGWDAFGLPAENAAIKAKVHPRSWTLQNIGHMREQFVLLGLSYDWEREVTTCEPEYFVHEQRIFIEMWKRGPGLSQGALVNWCPVDQTVLANEQVEDGLCWRCRSVVQQRELEQWFLKVTAYADELLADAHRLLEGKWADKVLRMQEHWIGRSEGARIKFPLLAGRRRRRATSASRCSRRGPTRSTARPSCRSPPSIRSSSARRPRRRRSPRAVAKEDKIKRTAEDYDKRGVDTGLRVKNPVDRRGDPGLRRQLRAHGLRHRRGHGGAGARSARFRVRDRNMGSKSESSFNPRARRSTQRR